MRRLREPQTFIVAAVILLIGYFALVPLLYLVWQTFYDGQSVTLRNFQDAYSVFGMVAMARNSFTFAIGATVFSMIIGTALAYLAVRTDVPFKRLIFAVSIIPLIIPNILNTIAWVFLLSPRIGLINSMVAPMLGPGAFDVFSMWGMILVQGLNLSPLVFLSMYASFRSMDPSLEESAMMSGAKLPAMLRRITLPLVKPGLYAATLVIGVLAIGAFEVPAVLGIPGGVWVFTSSIWRSLNQFPPAYGQAGAYAMSLLVIAGAGVYFQSRLSRNAKSFQTISGKGFRPHPIEFGKLRWASAAVVFVYFLVAVLAPLFVLFYISTQRFYSVPTLETLTNMTFDNYRFTFAAPGIRRAARNSIILAIGTATSVMFVMAIASWIVVRTKARGRWLVDNLAFLPIAIPGLVLGVALLFVYLRMPIAIYGTLWILFIGYFTNYMPFGMRYASTSMYQISGELEESAHTSGASWWQTFRKINLPLLMPGLTAGWIFIVMIAVRELSISILLYSPGSEVLSIMIWEQWDNGQFAELAALGIVMVVALVLLVAVAHRFGARFGVR